MFIEKLEFTIPVDLCDLFSSIKKGVNSNVEFPASVNSYGTTQDAFVQVLVKSNKLTFKIDGVSSVSSIISKSDCKTLKLSVFDVDCSNFVNERQVTVPPKQIVETNIPVISLPHTPPDIPNARKRSNDQSFSPRQPVRKAVRKSTPSSQSQASCTTHSQPVTPVNSMQNEIITIKQEPDIVEIDIDNDDQKPDIELLQSAQVVLNRLQPPSEADYTQDYTQAGPSGSHNDATEAVSTGNNDNDNSVDYGNDDLKSKLPHGCSLGEVRWKQRNENPYKPMVMSLHYGSRLSQFEISNGDGQGVESGYKCNSCEKVFASTGAKSNHIATVHRHRQYLCVCGKVYRYNTGLLAHRRVCPVVMTT